MSTEPKDIDSTNTASKHICQDRRPPKTDPVSDYIAPCLDTQKKEPKKKLLQTDKCFLQEHYYIEISNSIMKNYSFDYLASFTEEKNDKIPKDFLTKKNISPFMRSKMVDWMLEVFHEIGSNEDTIFAAVQIMDHYLWKEKNILNDSKIHIIGIMSIYLASKIYDEYPISIEDVKQKIAHNVFDIKELHDMEKKILNTLDYNVFYSTTYEIIRFLLFDLFSNNKDYIDEINAKHYIEIMEDVSIYLAKMCNIYEKFITMNLIEISFCCLVFAFELIKKNSKNIPKNCQELISSWLCLQLQNLAQTQTRIKEFVNTNSCIKNTYEMFNSEMFPKLDMTHKLYFD